MLDHTEGQKQTQTTNWSKTEMKIGCRNKTTKRKMRNELTSLVFTNPEKRERYRKAIQHAATTMEDSTPQEKWNQICKITTSTARGNSWTQNLHKRSQ